MRAAIASPCAGLHRVGSCHDSGQPVVDRDEHDGARVARQALDIGGDGIGRDPARRQQTRVADMHKVSLRRRPDALSREGLEALGASRRQAARFRESHDRTGKGMFGQPLDRGNQPHEGILIAGPSRRHDHIGHGRPALSDRARLVEDDCGDLACALQRLATLDQHAERRGAAAGHHHGGRNRQSHGARAGDDEHGHRRGKAPHQRRRVGQHPPGEQRHDGEPDDDWHEDGADPIGQRLNRRARRLRIPHQPDDAGQHTRLAQRRGVIAERPSAVDRAANHPVPRGLGHRNCLAGQHRFVDGAGAIHHHAVHRDSLAGPHQHDVAFADLADGHVLLGIAAYDTGRRRLQPRQRAQCAGRAPGGSRLEGAAREHERDDEDHRLVVHVGRDAARGEDGRRDGGDDRVEKRRASADRNQRVHVGGPVPQTDPGADIELAARPAHRDRRDRSSAHDRTCGSTA